MNDKFPQNGDSRKDTSIFIFKGSMPCEI